MQMATSVAANELVGHEMKVKSKPRPFKTERVGHPEKLNQSLGVDVLEWYHPAVCVRQQKRTWKGCATRPVYISTSIPSGGEPMRATGSKRVLA